MRRNVTYLVTSIAIVVFGLGSILASGTKPLLGLDLQGGISLTLAPKKSVSPDALNKAVDVIRSRVDALGVAEPEISRQGENIVVDLPGVKDQDRARKIIGRTAELRFRPVVGSELPPEEDSPPSIAAITTTTVPPAPPGATGASGAPGATGETDEDIAAGPSGVSGVVGASGPSGATDSLGSSGPVGPSGASDAVPPTTVPPTAVPPTTPPPVTTGGIPSTAPEDDLPEASVVLPILTKEGEPALRLQLGPSEATGEIIKDARSTFQGGQWQVTVDFTEDGSRVFDAMAVKNQGQRLAIVLDSVIQSSPTINEGNYGGTAVISGSFTQGEADDLALVLRYGALPVELEEQQVQRVSPSLGSDQLRSALIAGLIGLALVGLYMLAYYRILGLVVWAGLLLSAGALYATVAYLGESIGLTLTLAGITGIIVSVGVTVDSYVVYYERLKDEVRNGRTVRSSLDRGFKRSFRTILAADLVSLIGAFLLYMLAVGSVRGFAFYLGLSTMLDILVAYFFMHPLVSLLGSRPALVRAKGVGIASGLDVPGVQA